jgi:basic membrane lipoprotein Med (substrate-binding protein (PBP1-ABC) superfamily)
MSTHKHLPIVYLILILVSLILTGCGGAQSNVPPDSAKAAPGAFKVAILLPGAVDDKGWSQAGYEGLKLVEKDLGAQVADTASVPEADMEKVFRQYAEEGYDFVIGHGSEFIPAAEIVAKEFPQTKFAVVSGYAGNNDNLGGIGFRAEEIGYLAGVVAGLKTKTNKIVFIGGVDYPDLLANAAAFEQGAKAVNPKVEVSTEWVGSWTDADKAREIALAQIASGADVILANADTAGLAAIEEAEKAGVYALGWAVDQHALAPNTILTSAIQRTPVLFLEAATLVQQGRWEGKQYRFGLQEGAQDLAPFYGLLTPEEETKVKALREDILTDKIDFTSK